MNTMTADEKAAVKHRLAKIGAKTLEQQDYEQHAAHLTADDVDAMKAAMGIAKSDFRPAEWVLNAFIRHLVKDLPPAPAEVCMHPAGHDHPTDRMKSASAGWDDAVHALGLDPKTQITGKELIGKLVARAHSLAKSK